MPQKNLQIGHLFDQKEKVNETSIKNKQQTEKKRNHFLNSNFIKIHFFSKLKKKEFTDIQRARENERSAQFNRISYVSLFLSNQNKNVLNTFSVPIRVY